MLEVWGESGQLRADAVIKLFIKKNETDKYEIFVGDEINPIFSEQVMICSPDFTQNIRRTLTKILEQLESLKVSSVLVQFSISQPAGSSPIEDILLAEVRRHLAVGSVLGRVVFATADQKVGKRLEQLINRNNTVCLGDSITYGYPYDSQVSWVKLLADRLGVTMINKGVNGDTLSQMASRFERDVISCRPALVVILGGTNDAFMGAASESVGSAIAYMVEQSFAAGICPALGLPAAVTGEGILSEVSPEELYSVETELKIMRNWIRNYAEENHLPLLDFYTPLLAPGGMGDPRYFVDGYHPNRAGYRELSFSIEKSLVPIMNRICLHNFKI
ncbi:lipolytic protein G-D-S-L family [Desulfofarcimen acetoxidans DSM 771]|uniref:Lipolytic protein G-D-S-L family n=1 Tax=Desulfofarcimen acetoxidans (strain ATCC 49208 / DSM 771 / KCTC 5769 / VKM B-1644 / 5575) TaxID=485916 RepID=C8W261_DESAS|nr:SGNH/GDSL hydrolase family protein [Desulfofarcimen acetoxidans]ACV61725.1 lipolytic protein G-D-S-L family [Desulfofarcimen acetoxidans DSM 771]